LSNSDFGLFLLPDDMNFRLCVAPGHHLQLTIAHDLAMPFFATIAGGPADGDRSSQTASPQAKEIGHRVAA
jgi:hypothetical protein